MKQIWRDYTDKMAIALTLPLLNSRTRPVRGFPFNLLHEDKILGNSKFKIESISEDKINVAEKLKVA